MKTVMLVLMLMTSALMPHSPPASTSPPALEPSALSQPDPRHEERPLDVFIHSIVVDNGGVSFGVVLVNNLEEPIEASKWWVEGMLLNCCNALGNPSGSPILMATCGILGMRGSVDSKNPNDPITIPGKSSVAHTARFRDVVIPEHLYKLLEKDSSVVLEAEVPKALRGHNDDTYSVRSVSRPLVWNR